MGHPAPERLAAKRAAYADPDRPPAVLPPALDAIPAALRADPRWVLWRLDWGEDRRRWAKVPYRPTGRKAKPNDAATWTTFEAVAAAYREQPDRWAGVGFVLGGGWAGVDLDGVRDPATGELDPAAAELVRRFGAYTEVSPSAAGVKLFGRAEWRGIWHKKAFDGGAEVEAYGGAHFFCVTGLPVGTADVGDIQTAADDLAARFADPPKRAARRAATATADAIPDDELVERAMAAKNGAKFARLWAGDTSGHDGDPSRADLALCGLLAYWTGPEPDRIDRLFRRSGLIRAKWDEPHSADGLTYGRLTIDKALEGRTEFYRPRREPRRAAGARAAGPDAEADPPKPSAAEVLAGIGLALDLWHDATQTAFASAGRDTRPVRSKGFRHYLVSAYRRQTNKTPNAEAIGNALTAIEAAAVHDGPERAAHVRVAGHGGRVYLHLADAANAVVEIDADGWRGCDDPPVRFRKPAGMLPLPMPERGGNLTDLRRFVNVPDDDTFALVLAWVAGCFRPDGPFPLVVLSGEQGSAKTTTGRVLKRLIDPSAAPLRSEPKEVRDLMIGARHAHVLGMDNLSHLPGWLSDALCRLATGGGFAVRELYANDDEVIFDAVRPVILTGIEDFVSRPDLVERSIVLRHPRIPEEERRPESALWPAFTAAHPRLLGAVLDRVSAGLRALPNVKLARLPRMADFALFAVACEVGAGEEPRFLAAYAANQDGACEHALDDSPLPAALVALMAGRDRWAGTPAELLAALTVHTAKPDARDWPKAANALTNRLRRLAPNLRRVHRLDLALDAKASDRNRTRHVVVTRLPAVEPDSARGTSSAPSGPSAGWNRKGFWSDDPPGGSDDDRPTDRPHAGGAEPRSVVWIADPSDGADDADDDFR